LRLLRVSLELDRNLQSSFSIEGSLPENTASWQVRSSFNLKTQRFELTDELRATNKEARKRWSEGKQLEPTDTRTDEEAQRQKH
jgi:hypothetical protein